MANLIVKFIGKRHNSAYFKDGNSVDFSPTDKNKEVEIPKTDAMRLVNDFPERWELISKIEKPIIPVIVAKVMEYDPLTIASAMSLLAETENLESLDYKDQIKPMIKTLKIKTKNRRKATLIQALKDFKKG